MENERATPDRRGTALGVFVAASFGFSWAVAELGFRLLPPQAATAIAAGFMFGPAFGAILASRVVLREPWRALGPFFRFSPMLVVAALAPLLLVLAAVGLSCALPGVTLPLEGEALTAQILTQVPEHARAEARAQLDQIGDWLPALMVLQGTLGAIAAGATINALFAFGEELGWRGFLQRYVRPGAFWMPCLGIGVLWGLWHAPLILRGHNYPQHPVLGVAMMTVFCVLLSPLLAWLRQRADSVYAAALAHGTLNASAGIGLLLRGGDERITGMTGLVGMGVLLGANLALAWGLRRAPARIHGAA